MKPFYEDQFATIYLGDCIEILPILGRFDIAVTSPPYNLGDSPWPHDGHYKKGGCAGGKSKWKTGANATNGVAYGIHSDNMPWLEYVAWQKSVIEALWESCQAIYYNHKPRVVAAKLWTPMELIPKNVHLRQIVTWARPGGMNFNQTAYVPTSEWIMILAHLSWRLRDRSASGIGDVWKMNPEKNEHPAPFPLALPTNAIRTSGAKRVIDPFCGSGTTLRAAKDLGVTAVGIDIDERFCELAAIRLSQEALKL